MRLKPRATLGLLLTLAAIAATVTALQGINHDQMIFYQAGLRTWAGQLPYRDFTVPQGPVAGLVFALFLLIIPATGGTAFVIASGALNAFATFLVWRMVRRASGDERAAAVAGLFTALWFLPVFGSYYNDHLAYCWLLAAGLSCLEERWALAGVLMAIAFHTKQTVAIGGGLGLLLSDVAIYRRAHWRGWVRFALATVAAHAVVFGAIFFTGGAGAYWRSVVRAPLQFAARSSAKSPWRLVTFAIFPWNVFPWRMVREHGLGRLVFYPVVLTAYAAAWTLYRRSLSRAMAFALAFLLISTLWGGAWLGRFHGQLFFGMGGVIALLALVRGWRWRWVVALGVPLALLNVAGGAAWVRDPATAYRTTDLWPIRMEKKPITRHNAEVVEYLRDRPGAIAMAGGDTYYIAAALRRAPWNPTVYFEFPLTVPLTPDLLAAWEGDFIHALEKNQVRYVIADTEWAEKDYVRMAKAYVASHFRPVFLAGPLMVLERM